MLRARLKLWRENSSAGEETDFEGDETMDVKIPDVVTEVGASSSVESVPLGYSGAFSSDSAMFAESLSSAGAVQGIEPVATDNAMVKAIMEPLEYINNEASALIEYAENAVKSGDDLAPSEIVMLTAKSQEFMFHSQLTANVANRTADGLQQLFRQQS